MLDCLGVAVTFVFLFVIVFWLRFVCRFLSSPLRFGLHTILFYFSHLCECVFVCYGLFDCRCGCVRACVSVFSFLHLLFYIHINIAVDFVLWLIFVSSLAYIPHSHMRSCTLLCVCLLLFVQFAFAVVFILFRFWIFFIFRFLARECVCPCSCILCSCKYDIFAFQLDVVLLPLHTRIYKIVYQLNEAVLFSIFVLLLVSIWARAKDSIAWFLYISGKILSSRHSHTVNKYS